MLAAIQLAGHAESEPGPTPSRRARARLYALDRLLDELERLNLVDAIEIPPALLGQLASFGILCPRGVTVSRLIERVFEEQEALCGQRGKKECSARKERERPPTVGRGPRTAR